MEIKRLVTWGLVGMVWGLNLSLMAATLKVCASGCTYTTLRSAWESVALAPGDTIELKAGEEFNDTNLLIWRWWDSRPITITGSKRGELPIYSRVNEAEHGALMPKLVSPNTSDSNIYIGAGNYFDIVSIDTTANTFTTGGGLPGANGDPMAFYTGDTVSVLPTGITANTVYIITGASGNTFGLLEYKDGPGVDISGSLVGTKVRAVGAKVASHLIIDGVWFSSATGVVNPNYLGTFGSGVEASILGTPKGTVIKRSLFTGIGDDEGLTQNGPGGGILINCLGCSIENTAVTNIKVEASESKGVLFTTGIGQVKVYNTEMNAASLGFLVGGARGPFENGLPRARMDRVYNWKSGYMMYSQGSGAPTGACFRGRFYRDTSIVSTNCASGQCYVCDAGGTWQQDLTATYRATHYLNKALGEMKQCRGCEYTRFVTNNGFAGPDVGNPGYCALISFGGVGWDRIENTTIKNGSCDNAWRGLAIGIDCSGGCPTYRVNNVLMQNVLMTNMADFPAMSQHAAKGDVQAYPYRLDAGTLSSNINHNTARYAPGSTGGNFWLLMGNAVAGPSTETYFTNNLGQQYGGLFGDGSDGTCGAGGLAQWFTAANQLANSLQDGSTTPPFYSGCTTNMANANPVPYVSSSDSRLTPGSPYSADCTMGCLFDGTDGKDLGADIDIVESDTCGVVAGSRECVPNFTIVMGSTRGIVSYERPTPAACSLTLYTDPARLVEDADTNSAPNKLDTRTGNIVDNGMVQFVLGTVDPLSPNTTYQLKLACGGGNNKIVTIKTYPAASGDTQAGFRVGGASVASQYSSLASMSSPTSLVANVNPRFMVPQGEVRYWQYTGAINNGPIKVVVAR